MSMRYIYILPLIEGLWFIVAFIITYTIAVTRNDIPAVFPYISDTGVWYIEKCIFSFAMGIGALLLLSVLYIRYMQVKEILKNDEEKSFDPYIAVANKISMYLGIIAALGVFIVGCVQEVPFLIIHLTAAAVSFTLGWLVLVLQTYVSFKLYPAVGSRTVNIIRGIITFIVGISMATTSSFGGLSLLFFTGRDITQWTPKSGAYEMHLISTVFEWILVFGVIFFFAMYSHDFKHLVLYKPKINLRGAV
ncbi:DNA damage-regulated autophagy modulator protein 2-like [Sitophilus oryzae]|uniref:DNA damage-regulated autophagy modulator protein 2-like n=1 Tax=Sitophilus oryzae TaxID=7048 RepID=A0A6J2XUA0_SITOR|nr:DNA damage-regulated autophagy modulator protein 2-like [Sitophilus oryzae]